jgi:methionyl-tRNA synthetase
MARGTKCRAACTEGCLLIMGERILVCVAWPYAKSVTHVGQIVGSILPGDIFARYQRMAGNDVLMVSGSDAHGTPITVEADAEGISPAEVVERYHTQILQVWERLGISWDNYTVTTNPTHYREVQQFFLTLLEHGYLFKATMTSPYCPTDDRFLQDRYILGTCPNCGFPRARGDQCEQCGKLLDPEQLIDPYCRICLSKTSKIEFRETEHYFWDLPKVQPALEEWAKTAMGHWRSHVVGVVNGWLNEGLKPRAFTRDIDWGVPVPVPGFENKRIYVWYDAVMGYLTATIEWGEQRGKPDAWREWWVTTEANPQPSKTYYFIGKDNITFHAIIWPALLLGHGELVLPYDVPANEFMQMGGLKASSSEGNVVWTPDALDRYGPDALRYYLAAIMPEQRDTNFSYDDLVRRNNDELVAAFGNAAHRTLTFVQKHFAGKVPEAGALTAEDEALLAATRAAFDAVGSAINAVHLRDGLGEAMALARAVNKYLDDQAPWKAIKTDRVRAGTSLHVVIQALGALRLLLAPYIPHATQKLHELLGFSGDVAQVAWAYAPVPAGQALPVPTPLFTKFDPPVVAVTVEA